MFRVTYNGEPIKEGAPLKDFRGDEWTFITVYSHGKVYVKTTDIKSKIPFREFFVTVFPGLKVEEVVNGFSRE